MQDGDISAAPLVFMSNYIIIRRVCLEDEGEEPLIRVTYRLWIQSDLACDWNACSFCLVGFSKSKSDRRSCTAPFHHPAFPYSPHFESYISEPKTASMKKKIYRMIFYFFIEPKWIHKNDYITNTATKEDTVSGILKAIIPPTCRANKKIDEKLFGHSVKIYRKKIWLFNR